MKTADVGPYRIALWRDQLVIVHQDAPPIAVVYVDGKLDAKTLEPSNELCVVNAERQFWVGGQ